MSADVAFVLGLLMGVLTGIGAVLYADATRGWRL